MELNVKPSRAKWRAALRVIRPATTIHTPISPPSLTATTLTCTFCVFRARERCIDNARPVSESLLVMHLALCLRHRRYSRPTPPTAFGMVVKIHNCAKLCLRRCRECGTRSEGHLASLLRPTRSGVETDKASQISQGYSVFLLHRHVGVGRRTKVRAGPTPTVFANSFPANFFLSSYIVTCK